MTRKDDAENSGAAWEDLLESVAAGDVGAFGRLYDLAGALLFRAVWPILRDVGHSEEVVQEIFLQVWRTAPSFDRRRGSAGAWLHTMARARAVDRVRRAKTSRDYESRYGHLTVGTPVDHVVEDVLRHDEYRTVSSSLELLSAVQREAVRLVFFTGLTCPEASRIAGVPLSTLKARLRSALRLLRAAAP